MKKFRHLKVFLTAFTISVASSAMFGATHVFAATRTWTGGGSDTKVSTAGNWGGVAPSAGDDLIFPESVTNKTVVNDMTAATSFNSITFNGTPTNSNGYTISGNSIALVAGITSNAAGGFFNTDTLSLAIAFTAGQSLTVNNDSTLTLSGVLSGSGNLTFTGTTTNGINLNGNNTFTGTVTTSIRTDVNSLTGLGASSAGTTLNNPGRIDYTVATIDKAGTIAEPFTLNVGIVGGIWAFQVDAGCGFSACSDSTLTLSGNIVLGADIDFYTAGSVTLTGNLSGAHTFTLDSSAPGALVINGATNTTTTPNGTYGAGAGTTTTYSGNNPSQTLYISSKNTGVVTGTYGDATVGGTLKGTGTVGNVDVTSAGTIAPGMSPGCLTMSTLTLNGTYQAELGGTTACTEYDQLKVTGNSVDVTGATLAVSLYNNFKPTKGQTFTIIDFQGTGAVSGTFANLAEGATFNVGGNVFAVSYVGGDGNDVVLTVKSVGTPDTGFSLIKSNPLMSSAVVVTTAGGLALIARQQKRASSRR
ncbi:MAG TPA: hypothetical protein VLF91_02825 [Candidatus Saccharimonadales bacterium]|nr:hypothetical protein [Candidatus Saccharimonadales bacterium]